MNMKKILLAIIIFTTLFPILSVAQTTKDKSQGDKNAIVESVPKVQKWGEATLIIKDDNGNVIFNKTEKYPIIDSTIKAEPFNNCWDWCRRVCDGYGVCWVSCGWHCSPWTK